jgi:hypothetical protein
VSAPQMPVRARATEGYLPLFASRQDRAAVHGQMGVRPAWWRRLCLSSFALAAITVIVLWVAVAGLLRQGRLGVVFYWAGSLVTGRPVARDRAGEFAASGSVGLLLARAWVVAAQLAEHVDAVDPRMPMHGNPSADFQGPDRDLDQDGALLHVYEELAQHHGQMEILRDVLLAESGARPQTRP